MKFKTYSANQKDFKVTTVKLSYHRLRSVILGPNQYVLTYSLLSVVRRSDGWRTQNDLILMVLNDTVQTTK